MRLWRRMRTCSCDLQHVGAAGSATSKVSNIARRFIVVLAMCTTVLVCLAATPFVSAAQPTSLQNDKLVLPLRSNMQKVEKGSLMTLVPARKLIVTAEQQEVSLKPAINLADESNHEETYMMAEGRELVAQTDDYTSPCANNKHDKSLCHHG